MDLLPPLALVLWRSLVGDRLHLSTPGVRYAVHLLQDPLVRQWACKYNHRFSLRGRVLIYLEDLFSVGIHIITAIVLFIFVCCVVIHL